MSLGGGAAMAAHSRHDKRLGTKGLQVVQYLTEDESYIGDTPAPGSDGHVVSGLQCVPQGEALKFLRYCLSYITYLCGRESLPHLYHFDLYHLWGVR